MEVYVSLNTVLFTISPQPTGCTRSVAQAKQWFNDCLSSHEHCTKGRNYSFLPTRLFDVHASKLVDTTRLTVEGGRTDGICLPKSLLRWSTI
ncbi:uncharacterized protein M421DRAFT_409578 [Didymella exigua CBS 183.55]|uniref:Uncharacterized protein n=1 Tax=Didymella exigua CBS 183.55 TaxID=1150837 RepID=A0A6A5R3T5_9PLEO|nr:uncharacterized protein M421DRAFT_409578 [Didymella exigua CBS 183.55]KAF1922735.1 hypothetical protein M421DRAFT_409578 [Didymella exigua CBS 183.55]